MTPPYVPRYAVRQREYATTIRENGAKGEAYEAGAPKKSLKGNQKSSQKSSQKILAILKSMPDATLSELSNATLHKEPHQTPRMQTSAMSLSLDLSHTNFLR